MKSRTLAYLLVVLAAVLAMFLVAWDTPGSRLRRSQDLARIDKVRVYLLQGADGTEDGFFSVHSRGKKFTTYGSILLQDEEVKSFMKVWANFTSKDSPLVVCHFPAYGLEFKRGNRTVYKCSISWICSNYVATSILRGEKMRSFEADSVVSKSLLEACNELIPHDRTYVERKLKYREAIIDREMSN